MFLNSVFFKLHKTSIFLILTSLICYWEFAYHLVRTDYLKLIFLYSALFFLFYYLIKQLKTNLTFLKWLAFGFRVLFILAIPNLSQDFYRFIWDGRMLLEGFNPYLFTVEYFINKGIYPISQAQELYHGMGSLNGSHYTNYPPLNQLCFAIAGLFFNKNILGSIVVMRLLIIAADFGTLYYGKRLLKKLKMPTYYIYWYLLNPFIIIELTGNLHFEGVMIFFFIWSLYLLHCGKWQLSAVLLALSISIKLIPLIFFPLYFQWFLSNKSQYNIRKQINPYTILQRMKSLFLFYAISFLVCLGLFLPFLSLEFITNYTKTVGLWFNNFEFNASLYYLARTIGYSFRGYNEIAIIGTTSAFLVILFVIVLSFLRKNKNTVELISAMIMALSFYYFTSTTVHPWYIAMLLILSIFTKYKFPLVWSFVIVLSYLAYLNIDKSDKSENLWIIAMEYILVYSVFIWEVFFKKLKHFKHI